MSMISRRRLIATGLAATAGASGLAVATRLAKSFNVPSTDNRESSLNLSTWQAGALTGLDACRFGNKVLDLGVSK